MGLRYFSAPRWAAISRHACRRFSATRCLDCLRSLAFVVCPFTCSSHELFVRSESPTRSPFRNFFLAWSESVRLSAQRGTERRSVPQQQCFLDNSGALL